MSKKKHPDIIYRFKGNPVITMDDLSFPVSDICNAGAVKIDDTYLLLVTIESLKGHRSLYLARSTNGFDFEVDDAPFMKYAEDKAFKKYEENSIMDGRITP
ncbi:MAG: glycosidase, partial [Deltaproteobacteria bacterium]|nr:glycosidase [Deltaproteobacteria bacterium]